MKDNDDNAGVSEVVGALMLVLVVVVAATSFAIFIADKQEELQNNERIKDRNENEKLELSSISLTEDGGSPPTEWYEVVLRVSSLHDDVSYLTMITINDLVVSQFAIEKPGGLSETDTDYASWGRINSTEQVVITILPDLDFYGGDKDIPLTSYLNIKISTRYGNSFTRNFLPPSSVMKVRTETQWDPTPPGSFRSFNILDGSLSEANTKDAEIVSWDWEVPYDSDDSGTIDGSDTPFTATGKLAVIDFLNLDNTSGGGAVTYDIYLTVTDQWGMRSITTAQYTAVT